MVKITVVNKHHGLTGIYIGRGSALGNPYSHMEGTTAKFKVATREEAIAKYAVWLHEQIAQCNRKVIDALNDIATRAERPEGVSLQCFCKPRACHGDVIKELVLNALENQT